MSKMKRHDAKTMSAEQLWSFQESAFDRAGSATSAGDLSAQMQKFQRLNEYYDQAVAEIRASLERK
jgi:hypothetical protein